MARKAKGIATLHFRDLQIGDEWESARRTVTEADIVNFAGLSGDFNPIHVDHETARNGPFKRPIAHGLLGLAIGSGLGTLAPHVATEAFVAILEWRFLKPVFPGDTLRVLTRVLELEPSPNGRRGKVVWEREILNQNDAVVQAGRYQTIVANPRQNQHQNQNHAPAETRLQSEAKS